MAKIRHLFAPTILSFDEFPAQSPTYIFFEKNTTIGICYLSKYYI